MNMQPDESPSSLDAGKAEKFRHRLRNEAHAIWLGTRLLMDHLKKEKTDDAKQICEALLETADNLKKLVEGDQK